MIKYQYTGNNPVWVNNRMLHSGDKVEVYAPINNRDFKKINPKSKKKGVKSHVVNIK